MIPRLGENAPTRRLYRDFLVELRRDFAGEIRTDLGSRLVAATDNSIYQLLPQAVIFPKTTDDVAAALTLATEPRFAELTFAPRGGGTGTNGQSLAEGVIIDVSRHMNGIGELNLDEAWVQVQPGVVLDQLNDFLAPHGVFFAPNLSPSSRATIGGMIATDASGKGSRVYGKTSQHLIELEVVLVDGSRMTTRAMSAAEVAAASEAGGLSAAIYRAMDVLITDNAALIEQGYPKLDRYLTGYNLAMLRTADGGLNLNYLIAGSEGTLGVVTGARLKLTPLPAARQLVVFKYASFEQALESAEELVAADPSAIETIDETVLELARDDLIYDAVADYLSDTSAGPTATINLVEFEGDDPDAVLARAQRVMAGVGEGTSRAVGAHLAADEAARAALWQLRKKGVGLLGGRPGERKPLAFIEDTVVPPARLGAYVAELRAILDAEGLFYGMFGHVDVGCLHVRPALNLRDPEDEARLRRVSDSVAELVQRHGGLIWGEHGKGFRAEYSPRFFGEPLFELVCQVKGLFDPDNRLNPGKVATPPGQRERLATIDAPKRGAMDRQIADPTRARFQIAVDCNGNGACFHYDSDHVMCPSSKVTRDRLHSPKGRAGLMREWLRQLSVAGYDASVPSRAGALRRLVGWPLRVFRGLARRFGRYDYSHEVASAMRGCLACKACATQCPIKVDVPAFRAEFMALYHTRYPRPPADRFVAGLEGVLPWMARVPRLANLLTNNPLSRWLMARLVGLVDTPPVATRRLAQGLAERGIAPLRWGSLASEQPASSSDKRVVIVQDAFTSYYEPAVVLAAVDLVASLGFRPLVLPFFPNGKGLHVKGYLRRFERRVRANTERLRQVAALGLPMIGIDPAVTLTYRDEYPAALGEPPGFEVALLQDWLVDAIRQAPVAVGRDARRYRLFGHCTETTAAASNLARWQAVFASSGLNLSTERLGCCGMSGAYGHERAHLAESRGIFEGSWGRHIEGTSASERPLILATGFSCRSQVKRFAGFVPRHPIEVLAEHYRNAQRPAALPAPQGSPVEIGPASQGGGASTRP